MDDLALDYLPLARKLAWKIAWLPQDVDDLIQEGMLQLIIAFRNNHPIRNPSNLAWYILNGWMQEYYKPADREDRYVQPPDEDDGWLPLKFHIQGGEEAFWATYLHEYLSEMRCVLGSVEADIAHNLTAPMEGVLDLAFKEMEEKKRRHRHGEKVRGYDTLVIKHEHIRTALRLGEWEWETKLKNVRSFTREFLKNKGDKTTVFTSAFGKEDSVRYAAG